MSTGVPWPEADALFRRDDGWLGTDDAYSVPLGKDRTLWLFGDTFLGPRATGRAAAGFVANSIAVQSGLDPSTASLDRWPVDPGCGPMFASEIEGEWLWPLDGIRLGAAVLVFLMRVRSSRPDLPSSTDAWEAEGSLSFFEVVGTTARLVADPDLPPAQWRPVPVEMPDAGGAALGTALLLDGDHVLAWAQRAGYARLARWAAASAAVGDIANPQWWCGEDGWRPDVADAVPVLDAVPTEFTVHRHDAATLVLTQVGDPVGRGVLEIRSAPYPEGPWSAPVEIYRPPEIGRPDTITYAGKAHPELAGGGLVVTYASIRLTRAATLADESVYVPRFARVDLDKALERNAR